MKLKKLLGATTIWFVTIGSGADAQVIHACVSKNTGDVRIVPSGTTCRPNEIQMTLGQGTVPGTSVIDSTGKLVGPLIGMFPNGNAGASFSVVSVAINNTWLSILADRNGFYTYYTKSNFPFTFVYDQTMCTGNVYFASDAGGIINDLPAKGAVVTFQEYNGGQPTILFAGGPETTRTIYSRLFNGTCFNVTQQRGTVTIGSAPLSNLGLTPPFAIQ